MASKAKEISLFIIKIQKEINKGYGFTPFIGSGIMVGHKFYDYLSVAVWKAVSGINGR